MTGVRTPQRRNGVVLLIVGILASVGYPAYLEYTVRAARSEGRGALLEAASRQEQFFLDNKSYADDLADLSMPENTEHDKYEIAIDGESADCPVESCYALTATPLGRQLDDKACGSLTLNSNGTKGATGDAPGACW
jgi:type IV pilus assembly protein PilE